MSKSILLIDDEADIREVALASLELTKGWEVHQAESGERGLEMARTLQPDAIVLDVMMPGMDGPETFSRLRNDSSTEAIPVVLMTAKIQPTELDAFSTLGVDGLVHKPFDPMTLGDEIAGLLGWD